MTAVYGSPEKYLELSSVQNILASQSNPGSELPPGVETYTRCMKDSGYTTTGITETLKMAADQFGASRPLGSTPAAPERELASADATCQLQAGFLDYYNAKFIEGAGAWITQNESWIAGANELKTSALGNAKRILENSGSAG